MYALEYLLRMKLRARTDLFKSLFDSGQVTKQIFKFWMEVKTSRIDFNSMY